MSEQPTAAPSSGGGKRILGVPRKQFLIIVGVGLAAGLAWYWYRSYTAAKNNAASGTSSTSGTGTDYSGQLSTLQAEIQALQQENAGATVGGGGSGGGGTWSGGGWGGGSGGDSSSSGSSDTGGSATTSGGSTSTSGDSSGATSSGTPASSGSTSSSSSGSTSSGSSSSSSSTAAPAPTGGHGTRTGATTATVTWNGNGAKSWNLKIATPGPLNGHTGHTTVPEGVYSGLQSGHSAVVTVTPLSASGTPGPSGTIYIPSN